MRRLIAFTGLLACFALISNGQKDSTRFNRKSKIFPVPALTYTPETQLTLGGAMFYFFDLAQGDPKSICQTFRLWQFIPLLTRS